MSLEEKQRMAEERRARRSPLRRERNADLALLALCSSGAILGPQGQFRLRDGVRAVARKVPMSPEDAASALDRLLRRGAIESIGFGLRQLGLVAADLLIADILLSPAHEEVAKSALADLRQRRGYLTGELLYDAPCPGGCVRLRAFFEPGLGPPAARRVAVPPSGWPRPKRCTSCMEVPVGGRCGCDHAAEAAR